MIYTINQTTTSSLVSVYIIGEWIILPTKWDVSKTSWIYFSDLLKSPNKANVLKGAETCAVIGQTQNVPGWIT